MTNLSLTLREAAQMYPGRPALQLDSAVLTSQLDDLSARAAGWLRERGLRPGDPVGIMLPNVPHFPVFYYGVLRRRRRRPDEPAAQGPRGGPLPRRLRCQPGARLGDLRRRGVRRGGESRGRCRYRQRRDAGRRRHLDASARGDAARRRRHRGDPVYLGNHRHPEGRRADARQHAEERVRDRHDAARPRP